MLVMDLVYMMKRITCHQHQAHLSIRRSLPKAGVFVFLILGRLSVQKFDSHNIYPSVPQIKDNYFNQKKKKRKVVSILVTF